MTALRRTGVVRGERGGRDNQRDDGGCVIATTLSAPDAAEVDATGGRQSPHPLTQQAASEVSTAIVHTPPSAQRIRAIYEAHLNAVYRFIYSKVGNREEAEDLTSQVFLKALRGLDDSRDEVSVQAWLFQVARTTIADHWRIYYRLPERSLDDLLAAGWDSATPSNRPLGDQLGIEGRAQEILAQLPVRYREILTYRFLLNYSLKETATHMGLSEANVKVLQFRALKKAAQLNINPAMAANPANASFDPVDPANGGAS